MSVRLFVGNLAYETTEAELTELFSAGGAAVSVRLPVDRETGRPRGFAFVEFSDPAQAEEAVRRLNQQVFKGRPLVVNQARPREEGGAPRGNAFPQGSRSSETVVAERRGDQPSRSFGPNAPPRGKRKAKSYGAKGERTTKRPIPERRGGQFFTAEVDDVEDNQGEDDIAFWAREVPETEGEK